MAKRTEPPKSRTAARRCFLDTLRDTANVMSAVKASGLSRSHWYAMRRRSKPFAEAWRKALDEGVDRLEEEAQRRALSGSRQPVFYQGKRVGSVHRYSDTLLMFLLRAHRPQRYRDGADTMEAEDDPLTALLKEIDGGTRTIRNDEDRDDAADG
jgi:hypothetical protein